MVIMHRISRTFLLAFLFMPSLVSSEVLDSSRLGFTSRNSAQLAAPPDDVYAALVQQVGSWWSSDHTISGSAENLRIDAMQGGCFCETLADAGSVRHLTVVHANPGKLLRMTGGLGPLQAEAVNGSLSWVFEGIESGTNLTVTYSVGGYVTGGLDTWSAGVDRVVGEQLARLARYVETGDPEVTTHENGQ